MEANAALIMSAMELQGVASLCVAGDALAPVSRIRPWGSNPREKNVLFVAGGDAAVPKSLRHVVLSCPDGGVSTAALLSLANDALIDLHAWDAALKEYVFAGRSLDDLAELGSRMVSRPFVVYDPNLVAIASSPGYWDNRQSGGANRIPNEAAQNLIMDTEYHEAAQRREPFYYIDDHQELVYCINIFRNGTYAARFVLNVQRDSAGLTQGEELLAQHFVRSVSAALDFARNSKEGASEGRLLVDALKKALCEKSEINDALLNRAFFESGWESTDQLQVVRSAFHAGVQWEGAAQFLCHTLERRFAPSVAVMFQGEMVWLVNLSLYARQASCSLSAAQAAAGAALADLCGSYACKAGESRLFADSLGVRGAYDEAGIALTVGFRENPELWHYRFADYIMPYLMGKAVEDLPPERLCHPALETLLSHDRAHGTQLADTLIAFLSCGQSITRAAEKLGVHRTSLQRRLERIQELVVLRLDDPAQVVHLLLSALLLKR